MKILTIAIPTYNRARNLELLLRCLQEEICTLADEVTVLVSDNASSDDTQKVLAQARRDWPELTVKTNLQNVGADGNFCQLIDLVESRYFWIFGDDDLPKSGVIRKLVDLLVHNSPDLVYLQSEWVSLITGPEQGSRVGDLHVSAMSKLEFAEAVYVWFTFISGNIVSRETLACALQKNTVRRYSGTSLVQLGWTLPVLKSGSKFLFVADACVLATQNNTGGYALLTVFGTNFARVVRSAFGSDDPIATALLRRTVWRYLPAITWSTRQAAGSRFAVESPWSAMRGELGSFLVFWLFIVPIGRFPKSVAGLVFQVWRVLNRASRAFGSFAAIRTRLSVQSSRRHAVVPNQSRDADERG